MTEPTKCVVFYSGGLSSWAAGKRAVTKYGAENVTLLFTDTLIEDPDLYRFLEEGAANIGAELVKIADGRSPWQVFNDEKLIGNTRMDPCSKILKREIGLDWLKANCDPADTVLVFGISHEEDHRYDGMVWSAKEKRKVRRGVKPRYEALGWPHVEAPLLDKPWLSAADVRAWVKAEGLRVPRLYDLGFSHNNCGGFCVKAGEGHFAHLLRTLPQVYAYHEDQEAAFNAGRPGRARQTVLAPERVVGVRADGSPLRKRVPMSLTEFRTHVDAGGQVDLFSLGGCDCFYPTEEAA